MAYYTLRKKEVQKVVTGAFSKGTKMYHLDTSVFALGTNMYFYDTNMHCLRDASQ